MLVGQLHGRQRVARAVTASAWLPTATASTTIRLSPLSLTSVKRIDFRASTVSIVSLQGKTMACFQCALAGTYGTRKHYSEGCSLPECLICA